MDYFQLLRAHQGYLERIAPAMLGNRPDAEDALQEAALSGYRHFDQLRDGPPGAHAGGEGGSRRRRLAHGGGGNGGRHGCAGHPDQL